MPPHAGGLRAWDVTTSREIQLLGIQEVVILVHALISTKCANFPPFLGGVRVFYFAVEFPRRFPTKELDRSQGVVIDLALGGGGEPPVEHGVRGALFNQNY